MWRHKYGHYYESYGKPRCEIIHIHLNIVSGPFGPIAIANRLEWRICYKLCPFETCDCQVSGWCGSDVMNEVMMWCGRWCGDDVEDDIIDDVDMMWSIKWSITSKMTSYRNQHEEGYCSCNSNDVWLLEICDYAYSIFNFVIV